MSDITTLKSLCDELKVNPKMARKRLRAAMQRPDDFPALIKSHKPRGSWQWIRASDSELQARTAVSGGTVELQAK